MINKPNLAPQNVRPVTTIPASTRASAESGLRQLHSACEGWMKKIGTLNNESCVSANELTSLAALIAYAAHKSGASEFRIERNLADRFNIANVTCLPAARFDDAMRYLVDQVPLDKIAA